MIIYFTHKKTNQRLTLDYIKDNLNKRIQIYDYEDREHYQYDANYIPFSNDFIIECVDDEFTIEELYYMILNYANYGDNNLLQKLKNKFEAKRKEECLRGY